MFSCCSLDELSPLSCSSTKRAARFPLTRRRTSARRARAEAPPDVISMDDAGAVALRANETRLLRLTCRRRFLPVPPSAQHVFADVSRNERKVRPR